MQYRCDWCGIRYEQKRNVTYRRKDFCSFKCKEDYIDVQSQVNGAYVATDDSPARNPTDWMYQYVL